MFSIKLRARTSDIESLAPVFRTTSLFVLLPLALNVGKVAPPIGGEITKRRHVAQAGFRATPLWK